MEYKVTIGISNKHLHLKEETYNLLFDEPLEKVRDLNQVGEFASNKFVTLKNGDKTIEKVRIVGPFRPYNQVELCNSDAFILGINPPVRKSGDVENSETITIIGPKGEITLENACILAQRHIHMNPEDQKKYQVEDNQVVKVHLPGPRGGIVDAFIKVTDNGFFEMHIDRDEANAFLLNNNDEVFFEI